jgi:plasmid stabilization system protein ParE
MSLPISISARAEQDMTLQYRWYLENADEEVAERYLIAVHETILTVAGKPDLGRPRHFTAPELAHIRSIQVRQPFDRHLLFYWDGSTLLIERIIHGSRDLPKRLLEEPGQP